MRLTQPCHYDNIKITVSDITRLIPPPPAPPPPQIQLPELTAMEISVQALQPAEVTPGLGTARPPPPQRLQAAGQPQELPAHPAGDSARNMTCVRKLEDKPCSAQHRGSREPSRAWMGSTPWDVQLFSSGLGSASGSHIATCSLQRGKSLNEMPDLRAGWGL